MLMSQISDLVLVHKCRRFDIEVSNNRHYKSHKSDAYLARKCRITATTRVGILTPKCRIIDNVINILLSAFC